MISEQNIWTVCDGTDPVLDILSIHGLTGDPENTWTSSGVGVKQYWPKWFCDSFQCINIYARLSHERAREVGKRRNEPL